MHKFWRIVGGVTAAIVLGALGSGLWELFLSPTLSWLSENGVRFTSVPEWVRFMNLHVVNEPGHFVGLFAAVIWRNCSSL